MKWLYHNSSVKNVLEENLENGTVVEVPKTNILGLCGMPWYLVGFGGALSEFALIIGGGSYDIVLLRGFW